MYVALFIFNFYLNVESKENHGTHKLMQKQ